MTQPAQTASKKAGPIRRLYDWTIHWAQTPRAAWALFLLAFAEASFFPIPPDVLLVAMALGRPNKSLKYAAICTAGSVAGGCLGYAIGALFLELAKPLLSLYGYTEEFQTLTAKFGQHGFLWIFLAALTPIPYKVFTIAAGASHQHVTLWVLVAASVAGRGLRFGGIGVLFRLFGPPIASFIDRYFNLLTALAGILLALGIVYATMLRQGRQAERPEQPLPAEVPVPADRREGVFMLSEQARKTLLEIARRTVEATVRNEPPPRFNVTEPELQVRQGAFVTLRTNGQLRGCIGRFVADRPLWQTVQEMAIASAREDPRFIGMQLRPAELGALKIEISVLSPLRRITDPLRELELGKHGIYIKRGFASGCFLPQVATETGWSKEEFLSHCCSGKAGLSPDAWKDPATEIYVFTAEIIEEE